MFNDYACKVGVNSLDIQDIIWEFLKFHNIGFVIPLKKKQERIPATLFLIIINSPKTIDLSFSYD